MAANTPATLAARQAGYRAGYDDAEKKWKKRLRDCERTKANRIAQLERRLERIVGIAKPSLR